MKKSQLKNALKPIVKECIQEALIEDGLLSKIISEVIKGTQPMLNGHSHIKEEKQTNKLNEEQNQIEQKRLSQKKWEEDRERRRKLLDATGLQADIFEGTEALSPAGNINESSQTLGPLAGTDPSDAGVDISGIMAIGGNRWKRLVK